MGTIITLLNQKGGVGKTSTCHHAGGTLAKSGYKVLLLDNDPQASLTQGFWGSSAARRIPPGTTIAALYDPRLVPEPSALIRPTGVDNLALVAGSEGLTTWNITPADRWGGSERGIAEFLEEVRDQFDVVLIDCPPNLHLCSWAALTASDHLVVPLQAEDYGAQGLDPVNRAVREVRVRSNPRLNLLGYLLTMFDKRLTVHLTYEATLRELYGPLVFEHSVPRTKDFVEAVAGRLPVSHHRPKSAGARAIAAVAGELLQRVSACAGSEVAA